MKHTRKILAGAALTALVAGGGVTLAVAQGGDEDSNETDRPISGADLDRASEAALAHTGEGRVSGTEVGDEESYYEVEVTLDDGSQVDVQLDERFNVVGDEADGADDEGRED
ncbi:MAG: hypothetical protein WKF58_11430 [Ilumatobacteraceae bacterium]